MDGVSAKQALEFIQSFGLTPFSCSQLLSILNKSDLDTKTMKPALPYVRAYRLKGAKGSDEVCFSTTWTKIFLMVLVKYLSPYRI